ncbi:hypothetical protein SLE2022_225900 [Rubroshorea leprosula]
MTNTPQQQIHETDQIRKIPSPLNLKFSLDIQSESKMCTMLIPRTFNPPPKKKAEKQSRARTIPIVKPQIPDQNPDSYNSNPDPMRKLEEQNGGRNQQWRNSKSRFVWCRLGVASIKETKVELPDL